MQVPQLPVCGLHVTAAAWFPHAATSVCTTEEEEVEIMKYRNLWKRGSFRKRACLTEIPRIMEKWQKGKHGKGIVKQPVTETCFGFCFFFLQESCFHREHINPLMYTMFPIESRRWSEPTAQRCLWSLFRSESHNPIVHLHTAIYLFIYFNLLLHDKQSAHLVDCWNFFFGQALLSFRRADEIRETPAVHATGRKGFTVYKTKMVLKFY